MAGVEVKNLTEARAEIARLESELETQSKAATELAEELQAKLTTETARAEKAEVELKTANETLEAAKAASEAKIAELETKNTEQATKISELEKNAITGERKAAAIMASIGQPPVEMKPGEGSIASEESIVEKFSKLTGAEKNQFFKNHENEILKLANKQRK